MFVYPDNPEPFTGSRSILKELDPTFMYLKHFENAMLLDFYYVNPRSTPVERMQAAKELAVADRKMKYWERHEDFSFSKVEKEIAKIKAKWGK